ncbi:Excinuclease ABC subunit C [Peptoniphilus asaccharolyticus DSM 20463]|uniref:UvrABC system protein C n=1 Tax=Peptoniphilus asaccharolyticus DSM 20463 TaxID=573058 RepID=A0A1W1UQH0_PEPAS|nr:excinuclease ABC subunit UvrC [Peptoniphilus asaccharolyticus]MBL7575036.1 excinuclease ABC subunit UvrC [Peptoniphilus asaccharolyticus]SMB83388.1 Excinuclease ABC subunit C [Peptoniphilus asaccharolyticus DSM 20463]
MEDIEGRLKNLPDLPGVYIMKNAQDEVIYVGKAKNLKKRVSQYFGSYGKSYAKVKAMVSHIADFEYIIVENEIESLILESNLIKDNLPKYNILLRDDKQYPYIKITNEKFPRVLKTRKILKDGAKYFGPYPAVTAVNDTIDLINRTYPLRTCSLNLKKDIGKYRPCLNYFIGKCIAPCKGGVDEDKYNKMVEEISNFLEGKDERMILSLKERMLEASKNLEFEKAAMYRDDIQSLEILKEKQIISNTNISENQDIIGIARGIDEVLVQVFFVREGKIIGREHYFMKDYFENQNSEIISAFIKQFYAGVTFIPRELIIESEPEDKKLLEEFLSMRRGHNVEIVVPQRGDKLKLVRMAKQNALEMINKYADKYKKKIEENTKSLEEIKNLINLDRIPQRIEAYDISNTYGIESVGSMVVFENGVSKKSDYRKFKIRTVEGPNDYASMKEVLTRRFKRGIEEKNSNINSSFSKFPDLIMMDGGKGQVNIALKVLSELNIDVPVCGLVKDDFHTTRGIIYQNTEYNLKINSSGYRMIYKIQEEAHRFAINYHRSLREKDIFISELDNIKNIGKVRKQNLMKHFKSIKKIKEASVDELEIVDGMNRTAAESIYQHFHGGLNG